MRMLSDADIDLSLHGDEFGVLHEVTQAFLLHSTGDTLAPTPSSVSAGRPGPNWVAAPGLVQGLRPAVGVTWTASLPPDPVSSLLIVDDPRSGRPRALLEATVLQAWRVAAAAALASVSLHDGESVEVLGLWGCGHLNLRVLSMLASVHPECTTVLLADPNPERLRVFARRAARAAPGAEIVAAPTDQTLLEVSDTLSLGPATGQPSVRLPAPAVSGRQVVLELVPGALDPAGLDAVPRVVDEPADRPSDSTAAAWYGLGALLAGEALPPVAPRLVYTPGGPGVIDVALAADVERRARAAGLGVDFALTAPDHPTSTGERS